MQLKKRLAKNQPKPTKITKLLILAAAIVLTPNTVQAQNAVEKDLYVAFPKKPSKVWASSSFIIGSTKPGSTLKVNTKNVKLNKKASLPM